MCVCVFLTLWYTFLNIDSSHSESHDHQSTTSGISTKKDDKEKILIPEKASSFKFHPGRLCEDQCFYCSGKFGLYDTPCHVGQIKSMERQQKILASKLMGKRLTRISSMKFSYLFFFLFFFSDEEKLTVDNCLCDACFRHVDRRANVPSYKKRLSAPGGLETTSNGVKSADNQQDYDQNESEAAVAEHYASASSHSCLVTGCSNPAAHSLRRKCIRKSVKKFLLKFEVPTNSPCIWLCQTHYDTVIQCSGCVLCKRRLGKNHMYHITSDTDRLEKALTEMGIPVQLGIGTAVCKLCRYFANLLMKPPDTTKSQKAEFIKNYRKRLVLHSSYFAAPITTHSFVFLFFSVCCNSITYMMAVTMPLKLMRTTIAMVPHPTMRTLNHINNKSNIMMKQPKNLRCLKMMVLRIKRISCRR